MSDNANNKLRNPHEVQEDVLRVLLEILEYQKDILACLQETAVKKVPAREVGQVQKGDPAYAEFVAQVREVGQAHREER